MARVVFLGTPHFAVPVLERLIGDAHELLVVTQPERPRGRGQTVEQTPVESVALAHGLTVLQSESVNTPEFLAELQDFKPEVGVLVAFGQYLGRKLLQIPPLGYLNVHPSLLPRHRGASPIAAAILAGDAETGVTVILLSEELDAGPIVGQERCAIQPDDTTGKLEASLSKMGADLLSRLLPLWLDRSITLQPQDDTFATLATRIGKEDGRVDWSLPADALWRQARAYDPWPGSFAYVGDQRIRLWRVRPLLDWCGDEPPGTVLPSANELVVATGQGALALDELQLAGRRRVSGIEFRRGQRSLVRFS
jgi:methionyl-tRNA formyltransferase